MLENPFIIRKIRQPCEMEKYAIKLMKHKQRMSEDDFLNALVDKGMKRPKAIDLLILLINSYDIQRNQNDLEYVEWKL